MCVVGYLLSVELSAPSWLFEDDWMCVRWWSVDVCWWTSVKMGWDDVMFNWVRVVDNFVVDDLWLGELKDDHGCGHDEGKKTESHRFPCFQCNESEGQWNKNSCFEFQAQQKWNHHFLDKAATCENKRK